MKFISPSTFAHTTTQLLREELTKVWYQLNAWHDKFEHRAFGEIKDGNLSYEEWRDIYTSNGWVEVSDFQSCYDPQSVTTPKESASYELDKAYLTIWKIWYKYEQLWRGRLNRLESERFDLRRVTQAPKITIDEALFICLGLSPSVFKTPQFRPLSLYERTYEIDDIHYQDYEGNNFSINSGLYDENGLAPIEYYLQSREEYQLIDRNDKFKCTSGRLFSFKFLRWAYKHKYLEEYEIKIRDLKQSPWGEKFARKLFNHLTREGCIQGQFESLWQWNYPWFTLHYLANELVGIGLIKTKKQFKDIKQYIDCDADLRKYYSENTDPESPADKKLRTKGCDEVDKALRPLERENDRMIKKELD